MPDPADRPPPEPRARLRRIASAVAPDVGILRRRRDFRLLFSSQAVSLAGSMMTFVAVPFQVYHLTGSSVAVGLLGLAELVPIIALALIGGALADAFDRRRLIQLSEAGAAVVVALLVANAALDHPRVWVLYACVALMAAFTALRRPALDALVPRLVQRDELKAASAIQFVTYNLAQIAGPALAGVLLAVAGLGVTYAVDLATFLVSLAALQATRTPPSPGTGALPRASDVVEGLRYAASNQVLVGSYVVDIAAMLLAMPYALFPQIASQRGGAATLGLLFAAPAVGSLVASAASGWTRRVHHHGRAITLAAIGWGIGVAAFGLVDSPALGLVFLALAGAADAISGIFRGTIWNETIPDRLRGRLAGVEMISWSSGPLLGDVRAGVTAGAVGVRRAIAGGGLLCALAVAGTGASLREFWDYDGRESARPPDVDSPGPPHVSPAKGIASA